MKGKKKLDQIKAFQFLYSNVPFFSNLNYIIPYSPHLSPSPVLHRQRFSLIDDFCHSLILFFFKLRITLILNHMPDHKLFAVAIGQNFY